MACSLDEGGWCADWLQDACGGNSMWQPLHSHCPSGLRLGWYAPCALYMCSVCSAWFILRHTCYTESWLWTAAGCTYAVLLRQPALLQAMLGQQPCSFPAAPSPSTARFSLMEGCSIADLSHDTAALARAAQLCPQLRPLLHELQEAKPSLLALAAALGDAATLNTLLALPGGRQLVSQADRLQRLPLWWAVASGDPRCAAILLAAGANTEARDAQRRTPLLQVKRLTVRRQSVMLCARCCTFRGCLLPAVATRLSRACLMPCRRLWQLVPVPLYRSCCGLVLMLRLQAAMAPVQSSRQLSWGMQRWSTCFYLRVSAKALHCTGWNHGCVQGSILGHPCICT